MICKIITRGIKEFRGAICQGMDVIIDLNQKKDFEESELFFYLGVYWIFLLNMLQLIHLQG